MERQKKKNANEQSGQTEIKITFKRVKKKHLTLDIIFYITETFLVIEMFGLW